MITCLQKIRQIARLLSDLLPQMMIFKKLRFEIIDGATVAMNLECLFKFQVLYLRICTVIFFHDLQNKDLFYEKEFCQLFICKYLRMFRTSQISKKKNKIRIMIFSIITCLQKIHQIALLLSDPPPQSKILKSLHFEIIDGAAVAMNVECPLKFQVLYLRA